MPRRQRRTRRSGNGEQSAAKIVLLGQIEGAVSLRPNRVLDKSNADAAVFLTPVQPCSGRAADDGEFVGEVVRSRPGLIAIVGRGPRRLYRGGDADGSAFAAISHDRAVVILLAVGVAICAGYLNRFYVLADNLAATFDRVLHYLRRRVAHILDEIAFAARSGEPNDGYRAWRDRQLVRLRSGALIAKQQVDFLAREGKSCQTTH